MFAPRASSSVNLSLSVGIAYMGKTFIFINNIILCRPTLKCECWELMGQSLALRHSVLGVDVDNIRILTCCTMLRISSSI